MKVCGFNRKTIAKASGIILKLLENGEVGARDIMSSFVKYMPKNEMLQIDAIIYIAIDGLLKNTKITKRESTHV